MSLFGLSVDSLYVNRILPPAIQDPFFEHWKTDQAGYIDEVIKIFCPLPVFQVSLKRREVVGVDALLQLAQDLYHDLDPGQSLSNEQPLRFEMRNGQYLLILRLAGVETGAVDLSKDGDQLHVRLGSFRRTLTLPQVLAALELCLGSHRGARAACRLPRARSASGTLSSARRIAPVRYLEQLAIAQGGLVCHDPGRQVAYGLPDIWARQALLQASLHVFVNEIGVRSPVPARIVRQFGWQRLAGIQLKRSPAVTVSPPRS